jgi:hypothetical protein
LQRRLAGHFLRAAHTGDLSALQGGSRPALGPSARAAEAYRQHTAAASTPSVTVAQALQYVRAAADQAG